MLECKGVTKVYTNGENKTVALQEATFTIADGEFVAIMGPSGSGKSTLMHILGALDTPTSGTYLLDGKDVSLLSDDELADIRRTKIGFVFQSFNLLPRTTVLRNTTLPLIYEGIPKDKREERAKEALLQVGINEERWAHHSNQLSGGQMQRVAIARALVNRPSLVLADEPTGNLDTKMGETVMHLFRDLNRKYKHTIVLITHEEEIAQYADRIIFIRDGAIERDTKVERKSTDANPLQEKTL